MAPSPSASGLLILLVRAAASFILARRIAGNDPVEALRAE
jgi:hypothetical protein